MVPDSYRLRPDGAYVDVAQGKDPYPSPDAIGSMFEACTRGGTIIKSRSAGAGDMCHYHFKPGPALCNREML
jgi:hypothetical protein